jgi:hypothetical protein
LQSSGGVGVLPLELACQPCQRVDAGQALAIRPPMPYQHQDVKDVDHGINLAKRF